VAAGDSAHVREEVGDLLFSVAQLARHLDVDPEGALRDAGGKFERRFRSIEASLAAEGRTAADASMAELEALWARAKREIG
jgi:ATP diphosphatase